MNIHHVLCDPYLVSFPFYTIPILVSSHFYIHSVYILSVNGDAVWNIQVLKGEEVVIEKNA